MSTTPTVNMWLTLPPGCRIEAEAITDAEYRIVFGDPRKDGHTIDADRSALKDLASIVGEVITRDPGEPALIINQ